MSIRIHPYDDHGRLATLPPDLQEQIEDWEAEALERHREYQRLKHDSEQLPRFLQRCTSLELEVKKLRRECT